MDRRRLERRWSGWLMALALLASCGCQTVRTPEEQIASGNLPAEFTKVSMPEYVVEPPDLLVVEVLETLPGRPITGGPQSYAREALKWTSPNWPTPAAMKSARNLS